MLMTVQCPSCQGPCRVSESSLGQRVRCPACGRPFLCGTVSPPSLETHPLPDEQPAPVRASVPTRAAQPQAAGPSVHFRCPRCSRPLETPAQNAGQKVNCPDCNQRLQIPQPDAAPAAYAVVVPAPPPPAAPPEEEIPEAELAVAPKKRRPAAVRREHCLECGLDVSGRQRVQTCPDCGSLFCSSNCFREHRHHAHSRR